MPSTKTSILVLGAGELGLFVIRNLVSRASSTTVTVFLRHSTITSIERCKQAEIGELRALGVQFLPGDLVTSSIDDLASLFAPFHTVIGCTGFVAGPGIQIKLAQAVLAAAVKRYFPWQFGVDYDVIGRGSAQDLFDEQLEVRELLRAQRSTQWVIVSTGMFTSFLFEPAFGVVDVAGNKVHALGNWDTSVTVTTPEDIGALTADVVFSDQPTFVNCVVYTAGDTLTYGRLADIVDSVLGRKLHRLEWTVPMLQTELAKDPNNAIKKYRVVFAEGRGVSWDVKNTFNGQRQVAVVDVEQWAHANLMK